MDILFEIWKRLRTRTYGPKYPDGSEEDQIHACVTHALHECRELLSGHFGIPAECMSAFFKTHTELRVEPDGPEYMIDFTWTTYPGKRRFKSIQTSYRWMNCILLACECENGGLHYAVEDFTKLIDIKSPIKVMVYRGPLNQTHGFGECRDIFTSILRSRSDRPNGEEWLFVGIPWVEKKPWPLLAGSGAEVHVLKIQDSLPTIVPPEWPVE